MASGMSLASLVEAGEFIPSSGTYVCCKATALEDLNKKHTQPMPKEHAAAPGWLKLRHQRLRRWAARWTVGRGRFSVGASEPVSLCRQKACYVFGGPPRPSKIGSSGADFRPQCEAQNPGARNLPFSGIQVPFSGIQALVPPGIWAQFPAHLSLWTSHFWV